MFVSVVISTFLGGLTGVQAGLRSPPAVYLAQRIEDTEFTSVFVQGANLNLGGIEDVEGRSLAYGSASSTSGHLMPAYYLGQNDTTPSSTIFTGSHDATVDAVANGTVEVGALNSVVWNHRFSANTTGGTSVFYITDEYVDYLWVAGAGIVETWNDILAAWNGILPEDGVNCTDINGLLTQAFLDASADDSLGAALFAAYSTVGYVPIDPGEYNPIEETGCALGMIEEIYCSEPVPEDLGNVAGTSSNATEKPEEVKDTADTSEMAPPAEENQVEDTSTPKDLSVAAIVKDPKGTLLSLFFVLTVGVLSLC